LSRLPSNQNRRELFPNAGKRLGHLQRVCFHPLSRTILGSCRSTLNRPFTSRFIIVNHQKFHLGKGAFLAIAVETGRNDVLPVGFTPEPEWHTMIHRGPTGISTGEIDLDFPRAVIAAEVLMNDEQTQNGPPGSIPG